MHRFVRFEQSKSFTLAATGFRRAICIISIILYQSDTLKKKKKIPLLSVRERRAIVDNLYECAIERYDDGITFFFLSSSFVYYYNAT